MIIQEPTFSSASSREELVQSREQQIKGRYTTSLAEIQKNIMAARVIQEANERNAYLDVDLMFRILNELEVNNRLEYPFFAGRKLNRFVNPSIEDHNANMAEMNADIDTIRQAITMVNGKIDRIRRTTSRASKMILAGIKYTEQKIKEFRAQIGLAKYTYSEDFSTVAGIDLDKSTAEVDTDRHILQAKRANMFEGNVKFGFMSSENLEAISSDRSILSVQAAFYRIFMAGNDSTATLQIIKDRRESTEISIIANFIGLSNYRANTIIIDTAHKVATRTSIYIESQGERKTVVENAILFNSVYTFAFEETQIDKIIIRMTQTIESALTVDNRFSYQYRINYVQPQLNRFVDDVTFITKQINVEFPITDISMEAKDERPEGTDINYFVSKDGVNYLPITPRNIATAPNNIVNISSKRADSLEYITNENMFWHRLTPIDSLGEVTLYNILEHNELPQILDGVLAIETSDTEEIIKDSIQVYRGIDDWSIEKTKFENQVSIKNVLYRIKRISSTDDGTEGNIMTDIRSIDAYIRIDSEIHVVNRAGAVNTTYPITNDNIIVKDVKTEKRIPFTSWGNKTIQLSGATTNTKVSVTYHAKVSDIEEQDRVLIDIDPNSVKYKFDEASTDFIEGNDIRFEPLDDRFYININAGIPSNEFGWKTFYASFTYTRKAREEANVYRTYIYYEQETTLKILPFSEDEILAGNFHLIDGVNVSRAVEYTVPGGWHEIITTQPYKTDPTNILDVNELTNKASNAGILLGSYSVRRAYRKSMRQVSAWQLANVVGPSDNDAFAYQDGQILFNFTPEQLPDNSISLATHLKGTALLLKEAQYLSDGKYTFEKYIRKDEQILVEYETRPKAGSDNDIRSIFIKGVLETNKETGKSPSILGFDVLFF